jgi:cytidylate kinase
MMNVIAIDGPAASGKSSVATAVAEQLNAVHINTGSMYRAIGLKTVLAGIDPEKNPDAFAEKLYSVKMRFVRKESGDPELEVDGEFPGDQLRTEEASAAASRVATIPAVRQQLVELQRKMAGENLLVMEGRDIGTVVFPDAKYKFFLTASPEERAKRRLLQDGLQLTPEILKKTAAAIAERDLADSTRKVGPLKQADDAILVDSSDLTKEETVQKIIQLIREKQDA